MVEPNSKDESYESLALQIISFAGEGKFKVQKALEAFCSGNMPQFEKLMEEADQDFSEAHKAQIRYLQTHVMEPNTITPILLIHAMDILMNAMSFQENVKMLTKLIKTK